MDKIESIQARYVCGHGASESDWDTKSDVPLICPECGAELKKVDAVSYDVNIYSGSVSEINRTTLA